MMLSFRDDLLTCEQHLQHGPLPRRELERLPGEVGAPRHGIEGQRPVQDLRPGLRLRTSDEGAHARRQLGHGEGLAM